MKRALLCLLLCLSVLACVIPASADGPQLIITPNPIGVPVGSTQQFTAAFSDGSQITNCTWLATGSLNAIQANGVNTAMFAAGTLPATYVVTATCANVNGYTIMAIAIVGVI
jgi:hypothetical protein